MTSEEIQSKEGEVFEERRPQRSTNIQTRASTYVVSNLHVKDKFNIHVQNILAFIIYHSVLR